MKELRLSEITKLSRHIDELFELISSLSGVIMWSESVKNKEKTNIENVAFPIIIKIAVLNHKIKENILKYNDIINNYFDALSVLPSPNLEYCKSIYKNYSGKLSTLKFYLTNYLYPAKGYSFVRLAEFTNNEIIEKCNELLQLFQNKIIHFDKNFSVDNTNTQITFIRQKKRSIGPSTFQQALSDELLYVKIYEMLNEFKLINHEPFQNQVTIVKAFFQSLKKNRILKKEYHSAPNFRSVFLSEFDCKKFTARSLNQNYKNECHWEEIFDRYIISHILTKSSNLQ